LAAEYMCRLINHMDQTGDKMVVPSAEGVEVTKSPLFDLEAGYMKRAADRLPKQGSKSPWTVDNNYLADRPVLKKSKIQDEFLRFSKTPVKVSKGKTTAQKAAA
jgi:monooxygenase